MYFCVPKQSFYLQALEQPPSRKGYCQSLSFALALAPCFIVSSRFSIGLLFYLLLAVALGKSKIDLRLSVRSWTHIDLGICELRL